VSKKEREAPNPQKNKKKREGGTVVLRSFRKEKRRKVKEGGERQRFYSFVKRKRADLD